MFSKLKTKIQKEGGLVPLNENGGAAGPVPGMASQIGRKESSGSFGSLQDLREHKLNGNPEDKVGVHHHSESENGRDDVSAQLARKSEQCKRLESKISELAATIKEKVKAIDRLTSEGETRQQEHKQALYDVQSKQEESENAMREMFQEAIRKKEEENRLLNKRLTEAEQFKSRSRKREEETDEIQDFTTQELAKVKHMLLITQADLAKSDTALEERTQDVTKANKAICDLETHIETLNIEIAHHKNENEKFDGDRQKVTSEAHSLKNKISNLDAQISQFKSENIEKSSKLSSLEEAHANLLGEHQILQRNSEVYKNKSVASLSEKEDEISHLVERVDTLEQRVQDCDLTGDEQIEALKGERDSLESKLTEIRLLLTERQQKYMERISHLEDKISHLNKKILEDNEEMTLNEKAMDNMREHFQAQLEEVQNKYSDAEQRVLEHADTLSEKEISHDKEIHNWQLEMKKLRQYGAATERELEERILSLEAKLKTIRDEYECDKKTAEEEIAKLTQSRNQYLARETESESQTSKLEAEKLDLQTKLNIVETQCAKLSQSLEDKHKELDSSSEAKSSLTEEVTNLNDQVDHLDKSLKTKQQHYNECNQEKDSLLLRNAELSQQMETVRRTMSAERRDVDGQLTRCHDDLDCLRKELKDLQEKCEDLEQEKSMVMVNIECAEMSRYKETIQALEQQITEKNKTVKVQQQRLADLKKTLQRELKVQSLPNDDPDHPSKDSYELDTRLANKTDRRDHRDQSPTPARNHVTRPSQSASECLISSAHSCTSSHSAFNFSNQNATCHMTSSMTSCNKPHHQLSDVNLCYLKNVLLKFLLSRESESLHLVKAISTLLKFSRDEQKLVKETLEYRMSWFARKPSLGKGQQSKAIPPSW